MALLNAHIYRASVDEMRNHVTIKTELPMDLATAHTYVSEFHHFHCNADTTIEIVATNPETGKVVRGTVKSPDLEPGTFDYTAFVPVCTHWPLG